MSQTEDEIIATAMLLGAEFVQASVEMPKGVAPGAWRCKDDQAGTGYYINKHSAALGFLIRRGFNVNFDGDIVQI